MQSFAYVVGVDDQLDRCARQEVVGRAGQHRWSLEQDRPNIGSGFERDGDEQPWRCVLRVHQQRRCGSCAEGEINPDGRVCVEFA